MIKQIVVPLSVFCIATCPAFARDDYFQKRSRRTANTTPAITYTNPHTKRVIYHTAKAGAYAGIAGAEMYRGSPTAAESLYHLYKSTGDAYNANLARKSYVYPKAPSGFVLKKKVKRHR